MTVINTPMDYTEAEHINLSDADGVFWKQIIPMNKEIVYNGHRIKFDANYLRQVKDSFDARVLDQTAFQLANDSNQHDTPGQPITQNFDPQRYRGEVDKLALNNRGLFAKFKLTKDGAELIRKNPKLGVSASLKPNYVDSDGKVHPVVLRHVLGTLDPKIKGMSPWSKDEIALAVADDENEEVIDLAAADTDTPAGDEGTEDKVTIDKSVFDRMETQLRELQEGEALLDEILAEEDDEETEDNKVSLSNEDPRITEALTKVAKSEWRAQRMEYVNKGVPAKMLDLATPVMESPDDFTINLSSGDSIDPRQTIHELLKQAEGAIDLSAESGHGMSADEKKAEQDEIDAMVDDFTRDLF